MELSLAKLINSLASKPDLRAEVNGNVEKALSLGGLSPTYENKAALSAALQLLGKQYNYTGTQNPDAPFGWDGGHDLVPITATP